MKRDESKREQWRGWIAEWRASGKSAAEYGRERGVTAHAVYWWRRELDRKLPAVRAKPQTPTVTFVQMPLKAAAVQRGDAIEVLVSSDRRVRVPERFSAQTLQAVVRALETMS